MKFYNRESELLILKDIKRISQERGSLTVITGRRRLGKTALIKEFLKKNPGFYFFVSKKTEKSLLEEYSQILREKYPELPLLTSFDDLFRFLFEKTKTDPTLIVFDEFQNFEQVNPAVFSILQNYWDNHEKTSKINLVVIGSIHSVMEKLFSGKHEPLFGRCTRRIEVEPFHIQTLKQILEDHHCLSAEKLCDFYAIFGGTAKYYELLEYYDQFQKNSFEIIEKMITDHFAPLQDEGKDLVIEEFGKNYLTFFTILEAIASGKSRLDEISNYAGLSASSTSKYLNELRNIYKLIRRQVPITEKEQKRLGKYSIDDCFLRFWFRFIYKYRSWIEISKAQSLIAIIKRDFAIFKGKVFEDFAKLAILSKLKNHKFSFQFDKIGSFWDKKGENEIDIVLLNTEKSEALFLECKLQGKKVDFRLIADLKRKAERLNWKIKTRHSYYGVCILDKKNKELSKLAAKEKILIFDEKFWIK